MEGEADLGEEIGLSGGKEFRSVRFIGGMLPVLSPGGVMPESVSGGPLLVAEPLSCCIVSLIFSWFGGSWMLAWNFGLAPVSVALV